jgi:outer membrane cobalamin receptor
MNFNKITILFIFLFLSAKSLAQENDLKGIVLDLATKLPVPSVNICISRLSKTTITNKDGHFSMALSMPGEYLLNFTHVGYKNQERSIQTGKTEAIIYLEPLDVRLDEVTVYGQKRNSPLQDLTVEPVAWESSITQISSKDIERMGAVTTLDALKYSTSGMPSTQGRRKKYYYLVRGQNVSSDYAINGISLSTNGAGPMAQWVEAPAMLPANMIESIEVVRSGNSLLLGFSGLNGVINIKTKTFEKFETQAETEYGTFNTTRFGVLHGGKIGNVNYALSIYDDRTDGPKGRHSYENLWNVYGKVGYRYKNLIEFDMENYYTYGTRFVTQAINYKGLVLPERQLADIWEYDPMRYNIFTSKLKINESKIASTELQLGYILNRMDLYPDAYEFTVDPVTKKSVVGDSIIRAQMLNEPDSIWSLGLFQALSPFKNNVLRVAGLYASSANYAHGKSKKTIYSATLLDQHNFGNVDVHAGIKLIREYYNYYVPNQGFGDASRAIQNEWQPKLFNVSLGASYHYNNNLTINYILNSGSLPVDNTALQLYEDGTTGMLKREQRTGMDLGLECMTSDKGHFIFTLFMLNQKNSSDFTTQAYYDGDGLIRYYEKNISLRTYGMEGTYHSPFLWNDWSIFSNLSCKYAYQPDSSIYKKYAKQPPFIANAGVSYSHKNLDVNLMGKYVSDYKTDRFLKKEVYVGNYINADLTASYRVPHTILQLYGSMVNVFDVRYCTVSPIYPDFGRQMKIGLRIDFAKHEK